MLTSRPSKRVLACMVSPGNLWSPHSSRHSSACFCSDVKTIPNRRSLVPQQDPNGDVFFLRVNQRLMDPTRTSPCDKKRAAHVSRTGSLLGFLQPPRTPSTPTGVDTTSLQVLSPFAHVHWKAGTWLSHTERSTGHLILAPKGHPVPYLFRSF